MPAITSGKVLVTGASGYIGAWIVKYLVDLGYSVVVALRSHSQVGFVLNRFPDYRGKVAGVIVPNIESPGAYDEAVRDVDAIIHTASPVVWEWEDPSEIIDPAVKGATGILASAAKYGKNVKRVVFTSSSVAIIHEGQEEGHAYDETRWNTTSADIVEQEGKNATPWTVYAAAKTLAERSAWDFMQREKPPFDLSVIAPVYCFGPFIHEVTRKKGVGSSPAVFLSMFPKGDTSGSLIGNWVDVRDTAMHHILALSTPAAGGERISSNSHTLTWHGMYDILNDAGFKDIPGKNTYGAGKNAPKTPTLSNDKSKKIFPDFTYRTLSESTLEMGADLLRAGLL